MLDIHVARMAENQGFSLTSSHDLDPSGALVLSFASKVFQCSDMVDFHMLP